MLNGLVSSWLYLTLLFTAYCPGGDAAAAEKLNPCQMHEGTWLQCPTLTGAADASTFAFKKAQKAAKSKAPLVMLAGGPGQSASLAFLPLSQLLIDLNHDYDLIFFDPRGTAGPSALSCPQLSTIDLGPLSDNAAQVRAAKSCIEGLGRTHDLNRYGTDQSLADLERIRIRLGYEKLSFYGVSYGTRLALRYAALYPDRVDRIVLEGVLPPESLIGKDTYYLEPVLKKIADRCWRTPACQKANGDPWLNYQKLVADFHDERMITIAHPRSGEMQTVKVSVATIDSMLLSLLYSEYYHAMIPALLYKAVRGDLAPLFASGMTGGRGSEFEGLYYAIACTEDIPFYPASPLGDRTRQLAAICESYPFKPVNNSFHDSVKGSWPMLLLSGELDPVTAPSLLTAFKKNLPNARSVVIPGKGHNVSYLKCVARQIKAFLSTAAKAVDTKEELPCEDVDLPFILPESKS